MDSQLKLAISERNGMKLANFIEVLDKFHTGTLDNPEEYPGIENVTDDLYEVAKRTRDEITGEIINAIQTKQKASTYAPVARLLTIGKTEISDLAMFKDGIIKDSVVNITSSEVCCLPKYDGISCAVRFVWSDEQKSFVVDEAKTRGVDVGLSHRDTDMKDRILQVLSSDNCPWWPVRFNKFHQKYKQVSCRGELVVNSKDVKNPANYVAGKVNSKLAHVDPEKVMTYKIFEITRLISKDDKVIVPGQLIVCELIHSLDASIPFEKITLSDNTDENTTKIMNLYTKWKEDLDNPIDGVVYTTADWTYPRTKAETHGVNYGKYALKPNEIGISKLTGIEYTMSKDGKLNPILQFEPTVIAKKTCKQAKSAIGKLVELINEKHLGIGSTIEITMQSSIIAQVTDVIENPEQEITQLELPKKCMFCDSALELKKNKTTTTLTCKNMLCKGRVVKRLENFLKVIKVPGFGEKNINKLLDENDNDYMKLFPAINDKFGDKKYMKNMITDVDVGNLMIAIGLATKTTLKKLTVNSISENKVIDEITEVKKELKKYEDDIIVKMVQKELARR